MKIDIRKLKTSVATIFLFAILFLITSFLFQISGIYGVFFTYGLPEFGGFDIVGWITVAIAWTVKIVVKLFLLGMLLALLAFGSAHIANKI